MQLFFSHHHHCGDFEDEELIDEELILDQPEVSGKDNGQATSSLSATTFR